jgi:ferredoxin
MSSFDGLPPQEHPRSIFPDGQSVVVLGSHIRRGDFRSMEEGSLWRTPTRWLTSFDGVVRYIESHGRECVPYAPLDAPNMPKRPVRPGQCKPNGMRLSIEYAAVAAGLGEIGYHGMFMSEKYGTRQMLGLLVTDMEIEPGPGGGGGVCDGCMECVKACPLNAISADSSQQITCNGKTMTVGTINANACRSCPNGVSGDSKYFAGAEELHFEIENNQVKGDTRSKAIGGSLPNRLAAPCGRACIAHFEATHDTGYKIPFRVREPWGFRPDQERGW